jgi:hypothetical protein
LPKTHTSSESVATDQSVDRRRQILPLARCSRTLLFCRGLLAGKMTKVAQSGVGRRGPSQGKEETNAKYNTPYLHRSRNLPRVVARA